MVACPTGSIRLSPGVREPTMAQVAAAHFPAPVDAQRLPRVFHLGYHAPHSFGATPYLVSAPPAVVMVDCPRFNSRLSKRIEAEHGAVDLMLLTHKDDVSDHERWAKRFPGMRRVIHALEVRGPDQWPYIDMRGIEMQLSGAGPWELAPGLTAIFTPGHSPGHLSFHASATATGGDGVLFTGDHLAFNARLSRLDGFGRYGWDAPKQAASILACSDLSGNQLDDDGDYRWLLPGHGRRMAFASAKERRAAVQQAAAAFEADPYGSAVEGTVAPAYVVPDSES